jgi:uncharacterized membrane protein (UPF0127 family)
MPTVIVFENEGQRAKGLQHMPKIPKDTLFVFPDISAGQVFHSRNVQEPFDIIFLDAKGQILDGVKTIEPPRAEISAPDSTAYAIEAAENELERLNMDMGRTVNIQKLMGKT